MNKIVVYSLRDSFDYCCSADGYFNTLPFMFHRNNMVEIEVSLNLGQNALQSQEDVAGVIEA